MAEIVMTARPRYFDALVNPAAVIARTTAATLAYLTVEQARYADPVRRRADDGCRCKRCGTADDARFDATRSRSICLACQAAKDCARIRKSRARVRVTTADRLLAALARGPMSRDELVESLGTGRYNVQRLTRRLKLDGRIVRLTIMHSPKPALWALADTAGTVSPAEVRAYLDTAKPETTR